MSTSTSTSPSPFWRSIDLGRTALLLSDIQSQIVAHMPEAERGPYLSRVQAILTHFRAIIANRRTEKAHNQDSSPFDGPNDGVPLIIHHIVPVGVNHNAFVSPYNKLNTWALQRLQASGASLPPSASNPNTPFYALPDGIAPESWSADEILLSKLQPGSFGSSDLLAYLRAREIRTVVICGLETGGSVLSSVRQASDLDFHVVVPRGGCWSHDEEVQRVVLGKLFTGFADVVDDAEVLKMV